jgi:hypothetical protein
MLHNLAGQKKILLPFEKFAKSQFDIQNEVDYLYTIMEDIVPDALVC